MFVSVCLCASFNLITSVDCRAAAADDLRSSPSMAKAHCLSSLYKLIANAVGHLLACSINTLGVTRYKLVLVRRLLSRISLARTSEQKQHTPSRHFVPH